MRWITAVSLMLSASAAAEAGELTFANGSRIAGELTNEGLMVSTGSGLVEVSPEDIVALSREEIRLRDGRVIRGTLVGGQVKARTSLGEISVKVDELQAFRADAQTSQPAAGPRPAPQPAPVQSAPPANRPAVASSAARGDSAIVGGLPTVTAYQDSASPDQRGTTADGVQTAVLTPASQAAPNGRRFEVVGESVMYRDALFSSSRVGRVMTGQQVNYVDSIDRRLMILNLLVFDGGHWVKIRLSDGTVGWVPADTVREVR